MTRYLAVDQVIRAKASARWARSTGSPGLGHSDQVIRSRADHITRSLTVRRIELLESLPTSTTRPSWAANPHATAATLRGELERQLPLGSLPGEFPGLQNLGRIMRRAVRKVLADAALVDLQAQLELGEWSVYTPRD